MSCIWSMVFVIHVRHDIHRIVYPFTWLKELVLKLKSLRWYMMFLVLWIVLLGWWWWQVIIQFIMYQRSCDETQYPKYCLLFYLDDNDDIIYIVLWHIHCIKYHLTGLWCLWFELIYNVSYIVYHVARLMVIVIRLDIHYILYHVTYMVLVMWHDIHCIVYRVTWLMAFWAASFSCFRSRISLFSLSSFFLASFSVFWSWFSNNLSDKQPKNEPQKV